MKKTPDMMYGSLRANVDISGFTSTKALNDFNYLLDDDLWMEVGPGFTDINEFLKTINLSDFKLAIGQRKEVSQKLEQLQASQRATAKALGVSNKTVQRDIGKDKTNVTPELEMTTDYEDVTDDTVTDVTPDETPPIIEGPVVEEEDTAPSTNDEISANELLDKAAKEKEREAKKIEKKKELKKLADESDKIKLDIDSIRFEHGDFEEVFKDVPDGSVDLILTDPPYPKEFIEVWSKLSRFAKRVLKPNGFCIAYSGQLNLPDVMNRMSENLDYYWMFNLVHTGSRQLVNARNVFCGWKPLLVYQNGFKKQASTCDDFIIGTGLEKDMHRWQQAEGELSSIIEHFTIKGQTILEPFAGSGTTISAAYKLDRKVIAAEIDKDTFNIAKSRIDEI